MTSVTFLFRFLICSLFVLMVGCDLPVSNRQTSELDAPMKGISPLPELSDAISNFGIPPLPDSSAFKEDSQISRLSSTQHLNQEAIDALVSTLQEQANHPFIGIYGVLDSTGTVFNYSYDRLHFSEGYGKDFQNTRTLLYQIGTDQTGTQRVAVVTIPDEDRALEDVREWLSPVVVRKDHLGSNPNNARSKENEIQQCRTVFLIPGGYTWIEGYGFASFTPPVTALVCDTFIGGQVTDGVNWNFGQEDFSIEKNRWRDANIPSRGDPIRPCKGNPVKNPRIAAQKNSGVRGGRFGPTRSGGTQNHGGLDIANPINSPWFSPFSGRIVSTGFERNLGCYVTIQSQIGSSYYTIQFGHLDCEQLPQNDRLVSAGSIIGYQGTSGNLYPAVFVDKTTIPHSHIIVKKHDGSSKWNLENNFKPINPENVLTTKFDQHGNPIPGTDC